MAVYAQECGVPPCRGPVIDHGQICPYWPFIYPIPFSRLQSKTHSCTTQAASLLGGLVGPALGGLLADMSGLRAPFTLTGCAALMAAIYGAIRLPETMGTRKSEPTGASSGSSKEEVLVRKCC